MDINYDELKQDLILALKVGWDCNCGRGWYDVEKSEGMLWELIEKYGLDETGALDLEES